MIRFLEQMRTPNKDLTTSKKIINTILIFIFELDLVSFQNG